MHPALIETLRQFEQAAHADSDVWGALYKGSLGRGTADQFSDLDIHVWVSDETLSHSAEKLKQLLGYCGVPQFAYIRDTFLLTGFVGPEWRRVDLWLMGQADLKPEATLDNAVVVKDTESTLARLVADSPAEVIITNIEQVTSAISEAIDSQIYLALHNARGAVWSAMGEVSYRATELYTLLARLRGKHSYGLRYVETLLSPGEQALLTAVWPQMPEREAVRRAARSLWKWTQYVRAEAENALGQLPVNIDETQLLKAVDTIYTWSPTGDQE